MDDSGLETGSSQYAHTQICTSVYFGQLRNCFNLFNFSIHIKVNGHDVTSVADDVAMTILRSSPRRLSMTLGRAVSNLVAPPSCDSLPDIVIYKTASGQLGGALLIDLDTQTHLQ